MVWFNRAAKLLPLVFALTGCTTNYMLDTSLDPNQPTQPTAPTMPPGIYPTDYYVRVIADAEPAPGESAATVCSRPFWVPFVKKENQAVSLSAILGPDGGTQTAVPLFTVSVDTASNTCDIQYSERYLLPSTIFVPGQIFPISGRYVYQTTGTQSISNYLLAAAALASIIAPEGAPAIATATAILNSAPAQSVENQYNNAELSRDSSVEYPIFDFDYGGNANPLITKSIRYSINRVPLDLNNNPEAAEAHTLGSLTITATQLLTVLGHNPSQGQTYPDYSDLQLYSTFLIFPSQVPQQLFGLVNTGAALNRADTVETLPVNTQPADVTNACGALRFSLGQLGLNGLDTLAYLFLVYSASPYAQAKELANINSGDSPCLTHEEIKLAMAMNLPHLWLHAAD